MDRLGYTSGASIIDQIEREQRAGSPTRSWVLNQSWGIGPAGRQRALRQLRDRGYSMVAPGMIWLAKQVVGQFEQPEEA